MHRFCDGNRWKSRRIPGSPPNICRMLRTGISKGFTAMIIDYYIPGSPRREFSGPESSGYRSGIGRSALLAEIVSVFQRSENFMALGQ